ncbi:MAG: aspartate/glutamate racemase family protein [Anaerolineales bacterium]|jgi:Asp/Glu/hydantoin racemase
MTKKLAFVHTVPSIVELFARLAKELLPPDVEALHIADEILLKVVLEQGGLNPGVYRRVAEHVIAAEAAGATVVQLTCSSISPCADAARQMVAIPVLTIDEPMVDKALGLGTCIGVAATAPTTLKPTVDLIRTRAEAMGKQVQVESVLCQDAYTALLSGHPEKHDAIVRDTIRDLQRRTDVVLLAQASMAQALDGLPVEPQATPVLSSPRLAVERARAVLAATAG